MPQLPGLCIILLPHLSSSSTTALFDLAFDQLLQDSLPQPAEVAALYVPPYWDGGGRQGRAWVSQAIGARSDQWPAGREAGSDREVMAMMRSMQGMLRRILENQERFHGENKRYPEAGNPGTQSLLGYGPHFSARGPERYQVDGLPPHLAAGRVVVPVYRREDHLGGSTRDHREGVRFPGRVAGGQIRWT